MEPCLIHSGLNHLDKQPLHLALGLGQGQVADHTRDKYTVFRLPRLGLVSEQLELPWDLFGKCLVDPGHIGIKDLFRFTGELPDRFIRFAGPVHSAEEFIDRHNVITGIQNFRGPALAENPHEQYLHAPVPAVGIPHEAEYLGLVLTLSMADPILIPPDFAVDIHVRLPMGLKLMDS